MLKNLKTIIIATSLLLPFFTVGNCPDSWNIKIEKISQDGFIDYYESFKSPENDTMYFVLGAKGEYALNQDTLNFSKRGIFLLKAAEDGTVLWHKFLKSSNDVGLRFFDAGMDSNGDLELLCWKESGTLSIDQNFTLESNGDRAIINLIASSKDGTLQEGSVLAETVNEDAYFVGINVYLTQKHSNQRHYACLFNGSVKVGEDTVNSIPNYNNSILTFSFDQSGNKVWHHVMGGFNNSILNFEEKNNNLVINGSYEGKAIFDEDTLENAEGGGQVLFQDIYTASIDPSDGSIKWVNSLKSNGPTNPGQITFKNEDEILLTGSFNNELINDSLKPVNAGNYDVLLAQMNLNSGDLDWIKKVGGKGDVFTPQISYDSINQQLLLTGDYSGSFTAKTDTLNYQDTGENQYNSFIAVLDDKGNMERLEQVSQNLFNDRNLISLSPFDFTQNTFFTTTFFYDNIEAPYFTAKNTSDVILLSKYCTDSFKQINNVSDLAIENPLQLQVYPNPTQGQLTIEFDNHWQSDLSARLYDVNGQLVKIFNHQQAENANQTFHFNVKDIPKGVYWLSVKTEENQSVNKPIIKQ